MTPTALRQARGLTQEELGAAVGVSNRMIAYYERDGAQPPSAMLVELAHTLRCSTDALLGVKSLGETLAPKTARLLKRLQRIEELPPSDQRAVLKLVDAMLDTRRRSAPHPCCMARSFLGPIRKAQYCQPRRLCLIPGSTSWRSCCCCLTLGLSLPLCPSLHRRCPLLTGRPC